MFKHPMCGGKHETIAQARACDASRNAPAPIDLNELRQGVYESTTPEEVWPWATDAKPAPKRFEDRPRTKGDLNKTNGPTPLGVAYARALRDGSAPAHVEEPVPSEWRRGPIEEPAFLAPPVSIEVPSSSGRNYHDNPFGASEAQVRFIKILLEERDWTNAILPKTGNGEAIELVEAGEEISKQEASGLITILKTLPKLQDAEKGAKSKDQPWKTLSEKVPAGYYGFADQNGKNRFYRVSLGRNGFFKIQEQASDELFFTPLKNYAAILEAILEVGLDVAGKFYATQKSRCYRCNRELTDNIGNPYFAYGLGPDCGGK